MTVMAVSRLNQFISGITRAGEKRVNFKGNIMKMEEGNFLLYRSGEVEARRGIQSIFYPFLPRGTHPLLRVVPMLIIIRVKFTPSF